MSRFSSPFLSCFRSTSGEDRACPPPASTPLSTQPNLTTYLYQTDRGFVSLTWSRSVLGRSLHVEFHREHRPLDSPPLPSTVSPIHSVNSSAFSFHLRIKPLFLRKKHGSKKIFPNTQIFWSLRKAKFGSGPEPLSGFYVAVVVDKEMVAVIGDLAKDAYAKTQALKPKSSPLLVLQKEHVVSSKIYNARAEFGGKMREIQIDCGSSDDPDLSFRVDNQRVLDIQRLRWKFRGNERVEVDGLPIHISWDVYNWLFDRESNDGHAVFMFKFEKEEEENDLLRRDENNPSLIRLWAQQSSFDLGKAGKSFSSQSMSLSSSARSFGGSSSVMEWANTEEKSESTGPTVFSLLVHAWKR